MSTELKPQATEPPLADLLVAVAERRERYAFATLFSHFAPRLKAYMRKARAGRCAR